MPTLVIGTRTTRQMIEQGANMDGLARWGNVAVGSWWRRSGGPTSRASPTSAARTTLWRDAWRKIRGYMTRTDAAFSPEMMIEMIRSGGRVIEIPVGNYR